MNRYLYRGVNSELYKTTGGRILPKAIGEDFKRGIKYGQGFKYGEITYGASPKNAVVAHQKDSSTFPSSGAFQQHPFSRMQRRMLFTKENTHRDMYSR